MKRCWRFDYPI